DSCIERHSFATFFRTSSGHHTRRWRLSSEPSCKQEQKERSKSLSMFGMLVSPKLRATQLSFENALETLVE
ncbi:hypothetical protein M569_11420, partial [Genlisea aurea]